MRFIKKILKIRNIKDLSSFIKKASYKNEIFILLKSKNERQIIEHIIINDDLGLFKFNKLSKNYQKYNDYENLMLEAIKYNAVKVFLYNLRKFEAFSNNEKPKNQEKYFKLLDAAITHNCCDDIIYPMINNNYYNLVIKEDDYSIIMAIQVKNEKLVNYLIKHKNTIILGKDKETFNIAWSTKNKNIIKALWQEVKIREFVKINNSVLYDNVKKSILNDNIESF
jgi:hypothetical protein